MRYLLEMGSWLALAVGFMGAVAADVFCWREAYSRVESAHLAGPESGAPIMAAGAWFAIAGAILTAGLAIAIVMYLKSGKEEDS